MGIRKFLGKHKRKFILAGALNALLALGVVAESKTGCASYVVSQFKGNYTKHGGQYWQDVDEFNDLKNKLDGKDDAPNNEFVRHWAPDPELFKIWPLTSSNELRVEAADGSLIASKSPTREYISLSKIPDRLIRAYLLREDSSFFDNLEDRKDDTYWDAIKDKKGGHHGINWQGKIKALFSRRRVGGSGIDEQVAKMVYVTKGNITPPRKGVEGIVQKLFNEIPYAAEIDRVVGKDKVLEFYLNNIYLGDNNYGVLAASKDYFGKDDLSKLTLPESLFLSVLMKNPSDNPKNGGYDAQVSRYLSYVESLHKKGLLNEKEYSECNSPPKVDKHKKYVLGNVKYPDILRAVAYELSSRDISLEDYIMSGDMGFGFTIRTSIEPGLQDSLKRSFDTEKLVEALEKTNSIIKKKVKKNKKRKHKWTSGQILKKAKINAAGVILDTKARVVAVYGGIDVTNWGDRNRAFQDSLPIASTIKPIIYAECIESGKCDLHDIFKDVTNFSNGASIFNELPKNWDEETGRSMTLEEALVSSNNVITRYVYEILTRRDTRRIEEGEAFEDYLYEVRGHPYNNEAFEKFLEPLRKLGFDVSSYLQKKDSKGKTFGGVTDANNNVLGSRASTPLKVAAAYGSFLSRDGKDLTFGTYIAPSLIDYLVLGLDKIEYKNDKTFVDVFKPETIKTIRSSLGKIGQRVVHGKYEVSLYGKTGTGQGMTNVWYAGVIEFENGRTLIPMSDTKYSFSLAVMNEAGLSMGNDYAINLVGPIAKNLVSELSEAKKNVPAVISAATPSLDIDSCISRYSNSFVQQTLDSQLLSQIEEVANDIRVCAFSGQLGNEEVVKLRYNEGLLEEGLYTAKLGSDLDAISRHITSAKSAYGFVMKHAEIGSPYYNQAKSRLENL